MKDAIAVANKIMNAKLRDKTIKILKDPDTLNEEMVYPAAPFDKIPAWAIGAHHHYDGGELDHTISMTDIALLLADHLEKKNTIEGVNILHKNLVKHFKEIFGKKLKVQHEQEIFKSAATFSAQFLGESVPKINRDHLIAGCLLHDIGKVYLMKKSGGGWAPTGSIMDHADLSAGILFSHGFPEEVVHIVASHGGDRGEEGADPRSIEAILTVRADVLDAKVESAINPVNHMLPLRLLLMGEEAEE